VKHFNCDALCHIVSRETVLSKKPKVLQKASSLDLLRGKNVEMRWADWIFLPFCLAVQSPAERNVLFGVSLCGRGTDVRR
jgi:hypothetical protein